MIAFTTHNLNKFICFGKWLARDTSKKIRAVIKNKGESGKPLTNTPPLGYMKDPDDKNKWLIDERCAPTIREIFRLSVNHKYCYYRTAGNNNENLCSLLRSVSVIN